MVAHVMNEHLVLAGAALAAVSGGPGLVVGRTSMNGQRIATLLAMLAAGLGLGGVVSFWIYGVSDPLVRQWGLLGADFGVAVDGLSAIFLCPIFLVFALGSVYGHGYWRQSAHPENGRKLRLFYGTLTAGMALLVIAGNSILFLFGWEIMALSAFFLVTTEDTEREVRAAGWIYLVATHVATLSLFALFALLRSASGSFALTRLPSENLTPGMRNAIFVLSLIGFGLKAGIMPLHVWLPSAHAIAPSHVSAIMSGVIIKMGIYGLLRVSSLLPRPPVEWGGIVLGLGVVSGVLGVAFAVGQHDLKRLLAYHSIENIGIIVMGVGLAFIGQSLNRSDWVILGLSGALLHVWNHALFKALLFLSAGSVIHAAHTREIDHLGGLARAMPWTSFCFLLGAVAICGLPPLNGFVSEFLIYLGLFRTAAEAEGMPFIASAFAAPALALIGALAVACFVKAYGAVFLGTGRSNHTQHARESPRSMLLAMGVLVACCLLIGLGPVLAIPVLKKGVSAWAPDLIGEAFYAETLAPLRWVSSLSPALLAALMVAGGLLSLRRRAVTYGTTWGCGYVAPTPRMQYTSSSFAQTLVGLFAWVLRPDTHKTKDAALFPATGHFLSVVPDVVLDRAVLPTLRVVGWTLSWFRVFQRGSIQTYVLYVFLILIALLLWR
jgi:hydrogenase-4 component B